MSRVFAVMGPRRQPRDRFAACRVGLSCYRAVMVDVQSQSAADRIDRALARIEAALADRPAVDDTLANRHAALRHSMAQAVRALDGILASEDD